MRVQEQLGPQTRCTGSYRRHNTRQAVPVASVFHPAFSDMLVHFTGRDRDRPDLLPHIAAMTAEQRLVAILTQRRITGFAHYWSSAPGVCLSESRPEDVAYLVKHRGWSPFGVLFRTAEVARAGGGPVAYLRSEVLARLQQPVVVEPDQGVLFWVARLEFDPTSPPSDWRHEREWRIPGDGLDFDAIQPSGLLVDRPDWRMPDQHDPNLGLGDRPERWDDTAPWVREVPRWWWNAASSSFQKVAE